MVGQCWEYWRYCWAAHPGGWHGVQHELTHDGNNRQLTAQGEEAGGGSVGNI